MSTTTLPPTVIEPVFLRVPEAMKVLSLSRTVIYEIIRAGRLQVCHQGATTLIPVEAIAAYKALLMKEAVSSR